MHKVMYTNASQYVSNRDGIFYYVRRVPNDVRQPSAFVLPLCANTFELVKNIIDRAAATNCIFIDGSSLQRFRGNLGVIRLGNYMPSTV